MVRSKQRWRAACLAISRLGSRFGLQRTDGDNSSQTRVCVVSGLLSEFANGLTALATTLATVALPDPSRLYGSSGPDGQSVLMDWQTLQEASGTVVPSCSAVRFSRQGAVALVFRPALRRKSSAEVMLFPSRALLDATM